MNYENLDSYELHPEIANEFEYETYEQELAHELLSLEGEAELNHFLGNMVRSAWSGAKSLYNSPMGQAVKGQIISGAKNLGRKALPALGRAGGGWLGGKVGGAIGGRFGGAAGQAAGSWAGRKAGSWLGGQAGDWAADKLFDEYQDEVTNNQSLDVARGILRMTRQAATDIAGIAQSGRPLSRQAVHSIIIRNARQQLPGINFSAGAGAPRTNIGGGMRATNQEADFDADGGGSFGQSNSGTWYKQGNQIIVSGV